jgi:VIT family
VPQTPHTETHFTGGELVRDIVIGMSDGLTVPFALAAGLSGAVSSEYATYREPETLASRSTAISRRSGFRNIWERSATSKCVDVDAIIDKGGTL